MTPLSELIDRFRDGDRRALSRLLTLAARGDQTETIRSALDVPEERGRVVALTGSGGVGKSSLIGKLIEHAPPCRQENADSRLRAKPPMAASIAVLACDPQSPLSGGALLGDRVRMTRERDDNTVFIRSLAAPGGHQAVAEHVDLMLDLLLAFGFDYVFLETVGAGQGDTAVRNLADLLILLVQPETGDDLQWEKAGLLEVADLVVVHKSDLPTADRLEADLRRQLELPGAAPVPILKVSSAKDAGLTELWNAIIAQPSHKQMLRERRVVSGEWPVASGERKGKGNMPIQSYQDLEVWQRGMNLAELAYRLTRNFPKDELFGLTSQIRRAAASIPANIAEGWGRQGNKEFHQFIRISQGSLRELETHLLLSRRVDICTQEDIESMITEATILSKQLVMLGRRLQNAKR